MTAKEKAQAISDMFEYQICNDNGLSSSDSTKNCAKACADILVEEILDSHPILNSKSSFDSFYDRRINADIYWENVKQEIKLL